MIDLNGIWQESLRLVVLKARTPRGTKVGSRGPANVWKTLRGLEFSAPWETPPGARSKVVISNREQARRARGMVATYVAKMIPDPTLDDDELLADAGFLLADLFG